MLGTMMFVHDGFVVEVGLIASVFRNRNRVACRHHLVALCGVRTVRCTIRSKEKMSQMHAPCVVTLVDECGLSGKYRIV